MFNRLLHIIAGRPIPDGIAFPWGITDDPPFFGIQILSISNQGWKPGEQKKCSVFSCTLFENG
jgi:hypothetical protein